MRKIREALRLSFEGLSTREMALGLAIGRTTLREYLGRARDAGLSWPLPDALSDADLEHVLFPRRSADSSQPIPQPDWTYVHAELRRKGVTLSLLWQEYRGRVASITGQARSTLTRENGQPTDSNLAQPSSVILLRARTPICASVF